MHRRFAAPFVLPILTAVALGQSTTCVSVTPAGDPASLGGSDPAISADGRFVAFYSAAANLVPNDTNGVIDVFVRDRQAGQTMRVSVDSAGVQGNGNSLRVEISGNGRFVLFVSAATNLVPGDTNGMPDIFCHDRQTAQTTRVSLGAAGQQPTQPCTLYSVSADGRFVAFQNDDNTLVAGDNCLATDIFLRDRQLDTTTLVSAGFIPGQTFTPRSAPFISADGTTVVFESAATDLIQNDNNNTRDVFVWTRLTGALGFASLDSAGNQGDNQSLESRVSANGRYVAFSSLATNLVNGDTNNTFDVFVRDMLLGQTTCVSVGAGGVHANNLSQGPNLSDDGRWVVFHSNADNLVANDTNGVPDCFLHDRNTATTTRVSLTATGIEANRQSTIPVIAGNGQFIAFVTSSTNMVPSGQLGVYVRDRLDLATTVAYGTLCRGTSPLGPFIGPIHGQPKLGNAAFGIGVGIGFPQRAAVLALSLTSANIPVGLCTQWVGPSVTTVSAFTDLNGFASVPVPIPSTASLAGLTVFGEFLVLDPNGRFLGIAALTEGLAVTLN